MQPVLLGPKAYVLHTGTDEAFTFIFSPQVHTLFNSYNWLLVLGREEEEVVSVDTTYVCGPPGTRRTTRTDAMFSVLFGSFWFSYAIFSNSILSCPFMASFLYTVDLILSATSTKFGSKKVCLNKHLILTDLIA